MAPSEVLCGLHLMLPYFSGDDGLVLAVCGEFAELLNENLRLYHPWSLSAFEVIHWPLLLPRLDLIELFLAVCHRSCIHLGKQLRQVPRYITLNRFSRQNDLVNVLRHDFKVDNATTTLRCSGFCARRKLGNVESDAIIESTAQGNDEIDLLHGHVSKCRAVHAKHV